MKGKEFAVKKNILDLKHAVLTTKASVYLGLAFGSWISIFLALQDVDYTLAFMVALLPAAMFFWKSNQYFSECGKLQQEIYNL